MQKLEQSDLSYQNTNNKSRLEQQENRLVKQIEQISQNHTIEVQESFNGQKVLNFVLKIKDQEISFSVLISAEYPTDEPKYNLRLPIGFTTAHNHPLNSPISNLVEGYGPEMKLSEAVSKSIKKITNTILKQDSLQTNAVYDFSLYKYLQNPNSFYYVIILAVALRIITGIGPYHGEGHQIGYGDFECQRNWISIAYNRPITEWYVETDKDPWWRLDYPPVAGYVSYLFAFPMLLVEPQGLVVQRGYEGQSGKLKLYMRLTVIVSDLIFYFIPIIIFCRSLNINTVYSRIVLLLALTTPSFILIDHGHFQYNCVTYGLIMYAYVCLMYDRNHLACIFFTISLMSKLMASFYSFGFLGILLGKSLISSGLLNQTNYTWNIKIKGLCKFFLTTFSYALTLLITTIIIWLPWIMLKKPQVFEEISKILFPVERGLYQPVIKLPNFWCISEYFVPWQQILSKPILVFMAIFLCFLGSLASIIVTCYLPKQKYMLLAMFNVSLSFYFFAYSEHEKHVIYPLLFISLNFKQLSYMALDFIIFSSFSMQILFLLNKLSYAYFLNALFYLMAAQAIRNLKQGKYIEQQTQTQHPIENQYLNKIDKLTKTMRIYYQQTFRFNAYKAIFAAQLTLFVTYFILYATTFLVFVYIYVYSNALMISQAYKEVMEKRRSKNPQQ